MAATLTANIASLILKVDDPGRDDLTSINVWASTTSGFTPNTSNLVFSGKSFTILIPNLTPLVTYYVKYAYISEIDPTDYEVSEQLSGIPNKIEGDLIVDGSITASQLSADSVRGKLFSGNAYMDSGTTCTAYTQLYRETEVTVNVVDTVDFPPSGGVMVISLRNTNANTGLIGKLIEVGRYTGKTATSLTGVSGFAYTYSVASGDILIPVSVSSIDPLSITSYDSGTAELYTGTYSFRKAAGTKNAIVIRIDELLSTYPSDSFTYTGVTNASDQPALTGIVGLASWNETTGKRVVFDNPGFPTCSFASAGNVSTITTQSGNQFLRPGGGTLILAGSTDSVLNVSYVSYSGTTITLSDLVGIPASGTYTIIPTQSHSVTAAGMPFFSFNNTLGHPENTYKDNFWMYTKSIGTENIHIDSNIGTALGAYTSDSTAFAAEILGGKGLRTTDIEADRITAGNFNTLSYNSNSQFTANGYSTGTTQYGFNVNTTSVSASTAFYAFNATGIPNTATDALVSAYRSDYDLRTGPTVNLIKSHRTSNIAHLVVDSWPTRSTNGMLQGLYVTSAGTTIGLNSNYVILSLYNNVLSTLAANITTSTSSPNVIFSSAVTLNAGTRIYDSSNNFIGELDRSISASTGGTFIANATQTLTNASAKYTYCAVAFYSVGSDITLAADSGNIKAYTNTLNFYNPSSGTAHNFFDSTVAVNADLNITGSFRVAGNVYTSGVVTNQDGGAIGVYPSTADGYDTAYAYISGGAGTSIARGAYILAYGNENAAHAGKVRVIPGSTASTSGAITLEGVTKISGTVFNSNSYSSNTTLGYSNDIVFISASAAWNLTLPTPLAGKKLDIVRTDSSAFVIQVVGHINGVDATTNTTWFPASTANRRVSLVSNGTTWYVLHSGTYT